MQLDIRKVIAAGALIGAIGIGGAAMAGAQEDDTTTTEVPSHEERTDPTAPGERGRPHGDRPAHRDDREGCDHERGAEDGHDAEGSSSGVTQDIGQLTT
jgi:hypothetical protein